MLPVLVQANALGHPPTWWPRSSSGSRVIIGRTFPRSFILNFLWTKWRYWDMFRFTCPRIKCDIYALKLSQKAIIVILGSLDNVCCQFSFQYLSETLIELTFGFRNFEISRYLPTFWKCWRNLTIGKTQVNAW